MLPADTHRYALMWLIVALLGLPAAAPFGSSTSRFITSSRTNRAPSTTFTPHYLPEGSRRLQGQEDTGFDRFNELFADVTLSLGDQNIDIIGNAVTLDINDLQCSGIVIGELLTGHEIFRDENGQDVLEFTVEIIPFDFTCNADYRYKLLFIPGGGSVTATAIGNTLTTKIHLKSPSTFDQEPPTSSMIDFCQADIKTDGRVSFQGDFAADIANTFKKEVSNLIDNLARDGTFCRVKEMRFV